MGLPVLGICYGLQFITHHLGGRVRAAVKREYGPADVEVIDTANPLFAELHNFCTGDLSAFYFDIRTDSLYCDRTDSKRRRAARKFEVYMRRQGRTIHLDGYGRPIDDDPDDKKRWN